jgi:hypothetical protein
MVFTDRIVVITISVAKYRGNPIRNKKNLKKPKGMIMCNFLWMFLPIKLQLDSNRKSHTVTCHLY